MVNIFADIGIIIILATVGGIIARLLKQPLISLYILMGVVAGPVLHLIKDMPTVDVLSEIGIAFLLFIVGIELDLKKLKSVGAVASIGALIQMALSFLLGFGGFKLLGFNALTSSYAGIILMFSSTMVVIKLLVDKSQMDTLHGRIIVGMLLMQDVIAVVILSVIGHAGTEFTISGLAWSIFLALLAFGVAIFFSKVLFPQLFKFAAKSQELFFLLSLSVCFLFSLVFASIGFSISIGAFVAGLTLGNLPYNLEIISKVKSLRDFFATLFFVSMGIKLSFATLSGLALPILLLTTLTVIALPFIVFVVTMMFGYSRRVAFLSALYLSQVSEFALIAVTLGQKVGHITEGFLSLTIMVTLLSIFVTSYLVKYQDQVYTYIKPLLKKFDRLQGAKKDLEHMPKNLAHSCVLIGYDRIGSTILDSLKKIGRDVVLVDFNPDIISSLISKKIPCIYGDVGDDEVVDKLRLDKVDLIISTIPSHQETIFLMNKVRHVNRHARVIVTAYTAEDALEYYDKGADYVIVPHILGGKHAGMLLETISTDIDKLILTKLEHIGELRTHKHRHRKHISSDD